MSLVVSHEKQFESAKNALCWLISVQSPEDIDEFQTVYRVFRDTMNRYLNVEDGKCVLKINRWLSETYQATKYKLDFEKPWVDDRYTLICSVNRYFV